MKRLPAWLMLILGGFCLFGGAATNCVADALQEASDSLNDMADDLDDDNDDWDDFVDDLEDLFD